VIYQNTDLLEGKRISQRFRIKVVDLWREHAVFCTGDDLEKNRQVSLVLIDPLAIKAPDLFEKTVKRKQKLRHAISSVWKPGGIPAKGSHLLLLIMLVYKSLTQLLRKRQHFLSRMQPGSF